MKRVLFITSTRIGDAILSTGVLSWLIDRFPDARFTIACGPVAAPLFSAVPRLERVIVLTKQSWSRHWLGLWAQCAPHAWQAVVDLRGSAVAYGLMCGERFVKRSNVGGMHMVEELARVVGLSEPRAPKLWTAPEHWQQAESLIARTTPILGVGPAANWRGKEWPSHRFGELVSRLTGPGGILPGARVALFGAASERRQAEDIRLAVHHDRLIDLMGRVDLLTAYLCLRRCAFYVGNDSGTMHLAAAAGAPTLGLFGPSRDEVYGPWGPHCAVVRTPESIEELTSRPGYDHRTTGTLMGSLTVDAAASAAHELWRRCRDRAA
ncbi:MAG: glycosyltransferase family 9 protein [Alphaproteobacteria bacterium]